MAASVAASTSASTAIPAAEMPTAIAARCVTASDCGVSVVSVPPPPPLPPQAANPSASTPAKIAIVSFLCTDISNPPIANRCRIGGAECRFMMHLVLSVEFCVPIP